MFEKKDIKIQIASTNTTSGLVSVLQLVGTTASEMFATVRNDTSELEIQQIIYSPVELPKKEPQEEGMYPLSLSPLGFRLSGLWS